jgi:hypothetical protein
LVIDYFPAERYRPAMPGGGATGASATGVPLAGIRSGGLVDPTVCSLNSETISAEFSMRYSAHKFHENRALGCFTITMLQSIPTLSSETVFG